MQNPVNSSDSLEKLKKELLKRKHHEKEALRILHELIECAVPSHVLINAADKLNPQYYSDIVDERSISLLCGYPLCANSIEKMSGKKYHISLKNKKVYDLKERSKFCSSFCFKASVYYAGQISTEPLWGRAGVNRTVKLLEPESVSKEKQSVLLDNSLERARQQEVDMHDAERLIYLHLDDSQPECTSFSDNDSNSANICVKPRAVSQNDSDIASALIVREKTNLVNECTKDDVDGKTISTVLPLKSKSVNLKSAASKPDKSCSKRTHLTEIKRPPVTEVVLQHFSEWITPSTVTQLSLSGSDVLSDDSSRAHMEKHDIKESNSSMEDFQNGSSQTGSQATTPISEGSAETTPRMSHPALTSANTQRRTIILHRISKSMERLEPLLHGYRPDIQEIKALIGTFRFTRDNVTLRPREWDCVVLLILMLMLRKDVDALIRMKLVLAKMTTCDPENVFSRLLSNIQ